MIYERNEELQKCWEQDAWYGQTDDLSISKNLLLNPDETDLDTIASLKPQWFIFEYPFLLSPDHKILYGFCMGREKTLYIPKTVEVYDNLFLHEEEKGYERIVIPEILEIIVNTQNCFGFWVMEYVVAESNQAFCSEEGILFDKFAENLVLYPGGRIASGKTSYIQLPLEIRGIEAYSLFMKELPNALVLPPTIKKISTQAIGTLSPMDSTKSKKVFVCSNIFYQLEQEDMGMEIITYM